MIVVAFVLGTMFGGTLGLLLAALLRSAAADNADLPVTTYICTCGWCKSVDAPPDVTASWMRCDDCKGIAVRLRNFARDVA